jgi:hypothetical protein
LILLDKDALGANETVKLQLNLNSPATAPAQLSLMGVFGKWLFEPSDFFGEFPIAAHKTE